MFHMAINTTPYQAVFGIKAHREVSQDKERKWNLKSEQLNTSQVLQVEHYEETFNKERQRKYVTVKHNTTRR